MTHRNTALSITALATSILSLLLAWVPYANVMGAILAMGSAILALLAIVQYPQAKKVMAVISLILAIAGFLMATLSHVIYNYGVFHDLGDRQAETTTRRSSTTSDDTKSRRGSVHSDRPSVNTSFTPTH